MSLRSCSLWLVTVQDGALAETKIRPMLVKPDLGPMQLGHRGPDATHGWGPLLTYTCYFTTLLIPVFSSLLT